MKVVLDTNVAVVANGKSVQALPGCVTTCAQRLLQLTKVGVLVLDDHWHIIREYRRNLNQSGQPGVGDAFLKWVLTNHQNPTRCEKVKITAKGDSTNPTDWEEFPADLALATFDPPDRKFIAVANVHPEHPPVLQAVDSKWWDFRHTLAHHGIHVEFLCQDTAFVRQ